MPKRTMHKAWLILVICCLSQGAAVGIGENCIGLFYEAASKDLKCSMAAISLFLAVVSLSRFVSMTTFTRKLFFRFRTGFVMVFAAILVASRALLAFSTSVWQWWVMGVVSGVGASFLNGFASSIILERWFSKRFPTALSIVATFSGLFGIGTSLVIGNLIRQASWRNAIFLSYALLLVFELPTLFVTLNPFEKNMIPYGADEEQYKLSIEKFRSVEGSNSKNKVSVPFTKTMFVVLVLCFLNSTYTAFIAYLSPLGYSLNVEFNPALIVTFCMAGNMTFKLMYGVMVEKIGLKKASILILLLSLIGCLMLLSGSKSGLLTGSFMFGASSLIYTSMIPLVERHFYNQTEYPVVLQRGMAVYSISYAAFTYLYGMARDLIGSYYLVLLFMTAAFVINVILLMVNLKKSR